MDDTVHARCGCGYLHPVKIGKKGSSSDASALSPRATLAHPTAIGGGGQGGAHHHHHHHTSASGSGIAAHPTNSSALHAAAAAAAAATSGQGGASPPLSPPPSRTHAHRYQDTTAFASEHKLSLIAVADASERLEHRERDLQAAYSMMEHYQDMIEEQRQHIDDDARRHRTQAAALQEELGEKDQLARDRLAEVRALREEADRMRGDLRTSEQADDALAAAERRADAAERRLAVAAEERRRSDAAAARGGELQGQVETLSLQLHKARMHLQLADAEAQRENEQLRGELGVLAEEYRRAEAALEDRAAEALLLRDESERLRGAAASAGALEGLRDERARLREENERLQAQALRDQVRLKELSDAFDLVEPVQDEFRSRLRELGEASEEARDSILSKESEIHSLRAQVDSMRRSRASAASAAAEADAAAAAAGAGGRDELRSLKQRLSEELGEFLPGRGRGGGGVGGGASSTTSTLAQTRSPSPHSDDGVGGGGGGVASAAWIVQAAGEVRARLKRREGEQERVARSLEAILAEALSGDRPSDELRGDPPRVAMLCVDAVRGLRRDLDRAQRERDEAARGARSAQVEADGRPTHEALGAVQEEARSLQVRLDAAVAAAATAAAAATPAHEEFDRLQRATHELSQQLAESREAREADAAEREREAVLLRQATEELDAMREQVRGQRAEGDVLLRQATEELEVVRERARAGKQEDGVLLRQATEELATLREQAQGQREDAVILRQATEEVAVLRERMHEAAAAVAEADERAETAVAAAAAAVQPREDPASVLPRFEAAERALKLLQAQREHSEDRLQAALGEMEGLRGALAAATQARDEAEAELARVRRVEAAPSPELQAMRAAAARQGEEIARLRGASLAAEEMVRGLQQELSEAHSAAAAAAASVATTSVATHAPPPYQTSPLDMTFQQTPVLLDKIVGMTRGVHDPEMGRLQQRLREAEQEFIEARRAQDMLADHPSTLPADHPTVAALQRAEEKVDDIACIIRLTMELDELRAGGGGAGGDSKRITAPLDMDQEEAVASAELQHANGELVQENEYLHRQLAEAQARNAAAAAGGGSDDGESERLRGRNKSLQRENDGLMRDVAQLQAAVSQMEETLAAENTEMPADAIAQSLQDEVSKRRQLAAKNRRLEAEVEKMTTRPHREATIRKELKELKNVMEELRKENWRLRKSLTEIEQEKDFKFMKKIEKREREITREDKKVCRVLYYSLNLLFFLFFFLVSVFLCQNRTNQPTSNNNNNNKKTESAHIIACFVCRAVRDTLPQHRPQRNSSHQPARPVCPFPPAPPPLPPPFSIPFFNRRHESWTQDTRSRASRFD